MIRFVTKTSYTYHWIFWDWTFFMKSMSTSKMNIFRSSGERKSTSWAVRRCSEAMKLFIKIFFLKSSKTVMNKILGKIEYVDSMWKITKNINKSFCHFSSHIKISISLKKLDGILNRTVSSQILYNFSIDIKKYFNLIWW